MNEEELLRWRGFQAYYNNKTNQQLGIAGDCLLKTHKGKRYVVLVRQTVERYFVIRHVLRVYRVRTQGGGMLKMLKSYPKEVGEPDCYFVPVSTTKKSSGARREAPRESDSRRAIRQNSLPIISLF